MKNLRMNGLGSVTVVVVGLLAVGAGPAEGVGNTSWPAPDWGAPVAAPTAPGGDYDISFPNPAIPDAPEPVISAWPEGWVGPGESFTLTGIRFTSYAGESTGKDTTVWVYAKGFGVVEADVWRVTESCLTASLPSYVDRGMFLVWVENGSGASTPIPLNRTRGLWLGPLGDTRAASDTIRLFGKNLCHEHVAGAANGADIYVQPAEGGSFISCATSTYQTNPYAVEFVLPASLIDGSYRVYAHNRHGGEYGWSEPVDLVIDNSPWTRGSGVVDVPAPTGNSTSDYNNIQGAVNTVNGYSSGGTVQLAAGMYEIYRQVDLKAKVRLAGMGIDATAIAVAFTRNNEHDGIRFLGDHTALEDLQIKVKTSPHYPRYGILGGPWPNPIEDVLIRNVKWFSDSGLTAGENMIMTANGVEITGCVGERDWRFNVCNDLWIHDNTFYGGPYGQEAAPVTPKASNQLIVENNYFATRDWPNHAGNRQYKDLIPAEDLPATIWCKRMVTMSSAYSSPPGASSINSYIAHNNSSDVAVDDNKGEIVLLHQGGSMFCQVAGNTGTTLSIRTDGTVDGQVKRIRGETPITYIPTLVDHYYVVIVEGQGRGQTRRIVGNTGTTITVGRAWHVPPDATSKIAIVALYMNHVVYDNVMNAFPTGYLVRESASCAVSIDGNGVQNCIEGNTSYRTFGAHQIAGSSRHPAYFNQIRNDLNYDCLHRGERFDAWIYDEGYFTHIPSIGPSTLGNLIVGGVTEVTGKSTGGDYWSRRAYVLGERIFSTLSTGHTSDYLVHEGNVFENIVGLASGSAHRGLYIRELSESLYRSNTISVGHTDLTETPVEIHGSADPTLIENTYSGGTQDYYLVGSGFDEKPVAMKRVLRLQGAPGSVMQGTLPIANGGIETLSCSTSGDQDWIAGTAFSPPALSPEEIQGQLTVDVDSTGLPGTGHWATVSLNSGSHAIQVLVHLSLAVPPAFLDVHRSRGGDDLVLRWTSEIGGIYRVSSTSNLWGAAWSAVASNITAIAAETAYTNLAPVADYEVYKVERSF